MAPSAREARRLRDLTLNERWTIGAIIVFAAILRIAWNDVAAYSPADEAVYAGYTRTLHEQGFVRGYPEIVRAYETESNRWIYPSPLRWGYFSLSAAAALIQGAAEPRNLAWLSTVAGILVVPLIFVLALHCFGARVALLAAAFTSVSSIELALGRRALQDEVFCLSVIATVYLFLLVLTRRHDEKSGKLLVLAIASMTLSLAIKESFLYLYPAFAALILAYRPLRQIRMEHVSMLLLPPLLDYALFSLLARSVTSFFRIGSIVVSTMSAPYVVQYQSGPPHRVLFDFFMTTPLISILAAAAIVFIALTMRERGEHERALALFVVVAIAIFGIATMKNLRFHVMLDPLLRVLAAWVIASPAIAGRVINGWAAALIAAANASVELEIFRTVFVVHGVYDPVTHTVLEAMGSVPRSGGTPVSPMIFPIVCAALILLWWVMPRQQRKGTA